MTEQVVLPHRLLQSVEDILLVLNVAVHPDGAADEDQTENGHIDQSLSAEGFPARGKSEQQSGRQMNGYRQGVWR